MQQVTIPDSLARQLDAMGNHFLLIDGKAAREKDWNNPQKLMKSNDPKLLAWLRKGNNYGIAGGAGVTIVEADTPEVVERMKQLPAKTFTVKSGGKGFFHYYFNCSIERNYPLKIWENEPRVDMGYIKAESGYVVGPNSSHPDTGNRYEIVCDAEMLQINSKTLFTLLDSWIKKKPATKFKANTNNPYPIPITSIISLENLTDCGDGEYRGPHPFHGSPKTGMNFIIDLKNNTWHCWACDATGDGLNLFAQKEKIIKCGELLRGNEFKEALKQARQQGLIPEDASPFKRKINESATEFFNKLGKFQPVWFADFLMNNYYFKTMYDNQTIYIYNGKTGIYTPTGENTIKEEMAHILDEENRSRYYNDIEHHIKGSTFFERPKTPSHKIATFNGILNVETKKFTQFTPNDFITVQIPITYIPDKECPQIIKFLKEVVGENQIPLTQEMMGYCFYQAYPFHRAFMLVGEGANGKSTLINLTKRLLGKDNTSDVGLHSLCTNRFAPAQLYNKLANLCPDLPDKSLVHTGMFKMLTGGDTIVAEQKFKNMFSFSNHAKLIFSANKIPETDDDTIAFFRRWIIIACPNFFPPGEADPNILEKICEPNEMSGLLNWALEGLQRLIKQGHFSENKTWEEKRTQYIRASNSAKAYIEENLESSNNADDVIFEAELYQKYVTWCKKESLPSKRKGEFTQNMHQYMPQAKNALLRRKKKRIPAWKYLKIKKSGKGGNTPLFNTKKSEIKKGNNEALPPLPNANEIIDGTFSEDSLKKVREFTSGK